MGEEIELIEIKPMFTGLIVTANKYKEDAATENGVITGENKAGTLMEYQTVLAIGDSVRNLKVGDLIKINPVAYEVKKYNANGSVKEDMTEHYKKEITYAFKFLELAGELVLQLQDRDIDFIVKKHKVKEKPKVKKSSIITEDDIKKPLIGLN